MKKEEKKALIEKWKNKYGNPVKITFIQEFRWRLWRIMEFKIFYPLIFNEKRAGRFLSIQLAKLYCYTGIFVLPKIEK